MNFQQSPGFPLLYFSQNTPPGTEGKLVLYLFPQGTSTAGLPATIDLPTAWGNKTYATGTFIFTDKGLSANATALSAFATAVWKNLITNTRLTWFSVPDPNMGTGITLISALLVYQTFDANGKVTASSISAPLGQMPITPNVVQYRNIQLGITQATAITQPTGFDQLNLGGGAFAKSTPYFSNDGGTTKYQIVMEMVIPFTGKYAGAVQFHIQLNGTTMPGYFKTLDIGQRSFFYTPGVTALQSLRYPFLLESSTLDLYASFDPFSPNFDPSQSPGSYSDPRTFIAFYPQDVGWTTAKPAMQISSNYVALLGDKLGLQPQWRTVAPNAFACLVMAENPAATANSVTPYYWTPMGDFRVIPPGTDAANNASSGLPDSGTDIRMVAGLSGAEYFRLPGGLYRMLTFFPGQQGFAGTLPAEGSLPTTGGVTPTNATTSWACVSVYTSLGTATTAIPTSSTKPKGKTTTSPTPAATPAAKVAPLYYAQPDDSILYQVPASAGTGFQSWNYLEVPANGVSMTIDATRAFPLMPYAGASAADFATYRTLEAWAWSPQRREIIGANGTPATATGTTAAQAATPHGLLATFSSDMTTITSLLLANTSAGEFALTGIANSSPLFEALMTNQLFLVISDPNAIATYLQKANSTVTIQDWNFLFDPTNTEQWMNTGRDGARGTIMILKFHSLAIETLAADTDTWAQGDVFNTASGIGPMAQVSAIIQSIIADAFSAAKLQDHDLDYFRQVMSDPQWNGVLILNGYVPLSAIPPELEGLASGIDPSEFFAHHVGITASAVTQTSSDVSLGLTSLFGLISYDGSNTKVDTDVDYQFAVITLKVLFANSEVSRFASVIELWINVLFGEAVDLTAASGQNTVLMNGVLQQHTLPDGTIENSYVFATADGAMVELPMKSKVLNAVAISKGQYMTIGTTTASDGTTVTTSRFTFWGLLDFISLDGLDLFSFGRASAGDAPTGLNFSGLTLDMASDSATPQAPTFTLDAGQLALDLAGSTARPQSLFNHFPLTLTSFTQAKEGTSPSGIGYMGIQSPLSQSSLQYPWYALTFDLNLGTIGALAGKAGFVASVVAAWSPSSTSLQAYFGLKLPGSDGGQRAISIEGILKITFKTIAMIVDRSGPSPAYILILYNIALSFLSQTFPPSGQFNLVLFGDPEGTDNTTLGWYAAYAKAGTTPAKSTQGTNGNGSGTIPLVTGSAEPKTLPGGTN